MIRSIVFLSSLAAVIALSAEASATASTASTAATRDKRAKAKSEHAPRARTVGPSVRIDEPVGNPVREDGATCRLPRVSACPAAATPAPTTSAQSLFYMRLGEAGILGPELHNGPSVGLGYRMEVDRLGIDTSANLAVADVGQRRGASAAGSLKLAAEYFFTPHADRSFYVGGGLSWGAASALASCGRYTGSGLQAEVVAGYELFRTTPLRIFIQADATMPIYLGDLTGKPAPTTDVTGAPAPAADAPGQRYLPNVVLSIGVAWGKGCSGSR